MILKKKLLKEKIWFIRVPIKPIKHLTRYKIACSIYKCPNSYNGYITDDLICKTCRRIRNGIINMLSRKYKGFLDDVDEYLYIPYSSYLNYGTN